jgi:hypothetical protein
MRRTHFSLASVAGMRCIPIYIRAFVSFENLTTGGFYNVKSDDLALSITPIPEPGTPLLMGWAYSP